MKYPLVSIITPSYNQGQFIEQTLKSVSCQDYPNVEHIVIDGGSTDNTVEILTSHSGHLRWISEPDQGQSDALNKGFELSKGDIVGWLNSDDLYFSTDVISYVVTIFFENPNVDLVYGGFVKIDKHNTIMRAYIRPTKFSFNRLTRVSYISQPTVFFRANLIDNFSLLQELHFAMDTEFWLRAYVNNYRFIGVEKILAAERDHRDAKCVSNRTEMKKEELYVQSLYGQTFGTKYKLLRLVDKILLGSFRAKAFVRLWYLRKERTANLAFSHQFENFGLFLRRHLQVSNLIDS